MKLLYKLALSFAVFIGMSTTINAKNKTRAKSKTIFSQKKTAEKKNGDGVETNFKQISNTANHAAQEKKLEAAAKHHVQGCTVKDANKEAETIAAAILSKKVHKIDFNKMFLSSVEKNGKAHAGKNSKKKDATKKDKKHNAAKKDKNAHAGKNGKKNNASKNKKSGKKR